MKKIILSFTIVFLNIVFIAAQPVSPLLENPPKGSDVVVLPAVLDWNNVSGADCYYFEVLTDTLNKSTNQFCMTNTSSVQVTSNDLLPNTVYYWRVVAHDANGWGESSPFYSFKTADESVQGTIGNLNDGVIDLIAEEDLAQNQGNILLNRLDQVEHQLSLGNEFVAVVHMVLFKARVIVLRISGQISNDTYEELSYSADGVIDLIADISGRPTAVNLEEMLQPKTYTLLQNYPNPFNPSTTIEYSIPENSFVNLKIYDMTGREISTLVSKEQGAGTYIVDWNASKLSSGVYFYRLNAGNFTETKKMILAK